MPNTPVQRTLNASLRKLTSDNHGMGTPLPLFLAKAKSLHPALAPALEGIYCGGEGTVTEPLSGELQGKVLRFSWYQRGSQYPAWVEVAYIS